MSENNSELTVEKDLNEITDNSEKANNGVDVQFSFTIKGLKHPGNWKNHHAMKTLFQCCSGFEVKFHKTPEDQTRKSGHVSVFFDDLKSAQEALVEIKKCRFDGGPANIEAPECLNTESTAESAPSPVAEVSKPKEFFDIPTEEALRERTLYALHLFSSTNREIIDGIVDAQLVESVKFLPLGKFRQQAELLVTSPDAVPGVSGDLENFELLDGDVNSVLRTYNCDDYSKFVSGEEKLEYFGKDEVPETNNENQENNAPEIEEEQVTQAILEYVEVKRLNWAELNTREELYAICDIISAEFGGLPDSILKPAMLETLNKNLSDHQSSHWMTEHLHHLIREWKREIVSEAHFNRSSEVVMAAPVYAPVQSEETRKRKYKNTKSGRAKLGVGAFLQDAKQSLATENGRHDVDEDDSGNFLIDGEPLSFESWAKFTQSSQPDVVTAAQPKKTGRPAAPKMDMQDLKTLRKKQKFAMEQRTGAKKMKIMEEARRELAALDAEQKENAEELDDGEIVSEDEKKKKTKKKRNSSDSSSSSSSSSSSDSDDDAPDSRKRRRKRRKQELKKRQNKPLAQNPVLVKLFEQRRAIVSNLPMEQRTGFAAILRQIHSSGTTPASNTSVMQQASAMFKF